MGAIYTVGETTYDIIFRDQQPAGAVVGGSILNSSVTLGRLNLPVKFISRIGNDQVGDISVDFLKNNGVDCSKIVRFDGNSRLALAFLDEEMNASYTFYKASKVPELHYPSLIDGDFFVFGSTHALREEGRNELLLHLNQSYDKNVLTFYDPNIREFGPLELIDIRKKFEENLYFTKVLKGSNQDFLRLYETSNAEEIYNKIEKFGVEVLIVTSGSKEVQLVTRNFSQQFPVKQLKLVSTIGAGDNFNAGLVYGMYTLGIDKNSIREISTDQWNQIIEYAIQCSAFVCESELNYISSDFAEKVLSEQFV